MLEALVWPERMLEMDILVALVLRDWASVVESATWELMYLLEVWEVELEGFQNCFHGFVEIEGLQGARSSQFQEDGLKSICQVLESSWASLDSCQCYSVASRTTSRDRTCSIPRHPALRNCSCMSPLCCTSFVGFAPARSSEYHCL